MADALSLPIAEIAVLLSDGKLKARALVEQAIANHERCGGKLMAYSQWAPEYARGCADDADAAFAVCAGNWQPSWARRIWSNSPLAAPATMPITAAHTIHGTPRRIARRAGRRAAPAFRCAKAPRYWHWAATPRPRSGCPPR